MQKRLFIVLFHAFSLVFVISGFGRMVLIKINTSWKVWKVTDNDYIVIYGTVSSYTSYTSLIL